MATLRLTNDFKEFLNLLNSSGIEYLLIGGYAVGLYGHVRPTKDMDVWVATDASNLKSLASALQTFGFSPTSLPNPLFTPPQTILRMGFPPNRLELLSEIAGVSFADCYPRRKVMTIDGVDVPVIDLEDLKRNKLAAGRPQDLGDVDRLSNKRPT